MGVVVAMAAAGVDLRRVDLNLLVSLDALLSERHVTRAAHRLSVSQPTMSAALARLRKLFDDPLLVRTGHVLQLSPYAASLQAPVAEILARIEQTLTVRPAFDPATDARSFSIATTDYVALVLLRPLVEHLAREAPQVRLQVKPLVEEYAEQVRLDQIDLLIMPEEIAGRHDAWASDALFRDRFVCAAWRDHPDLKRSISLDQLQQLPYLAWRAQGAQSFVDQQLTRLGVERNVEIVTENFVIAPFLLRGTRLVTMIHEQLASALAEAAHIRLMESPVELAPVTQRMYWHPRRTEDPAHRWLRSRMADIAAAVA